MKISIGLKIRYLRTKKGVSQEYVAEHLHISQSAYARIENGESNSWASNLTAICNFFEIEPEEIVKQESLTIEHLKTTSGGRNNEETINQLSEKVIEQLELRIQEKDRLIKELQAKPKK